MLGATLLVTKSCVTKGRSLDLQPWMQRIECIRFSSIFLSSICSFTSSEYVLRYSHVHDILVGIRRMFVWTYPNAQSLFCLMPIITKKQVNILMFAFDATSVTSLQQMEHLSWRHWIPHTKICSNYGTLTCNAHVCLQGTLNPWAL